jgi:hypothetical protein
MKPYRKVYQGVVTYKKVAKSRKKNSPKGEWVSMTSLDRELKINTRGWLINNRFLKNLPNYKRPITRKSESMSLLKQSSMYHIRVNKKNFLNIYFSTKLHNNILF